MLRDAMRCDDVVCRVVLRGLRLRTVSPVLPIALTSASPSALVVGGSPTTSYQSLRHIYILSVNTGLGSEYLQREGGGLEYRT